MESEQVSAVEFPRVSIIVLNYNGLEHLKDCFSSLTQVDYPGDRLELLMVDNASTDGSVEYIQREYPQVRVIRNKENLGFAAGNNIGACAATGKYAIFLNNDMWVDSQFVHGLVQAVRSDPQAVCAGAKILNWDGTRFDFAGAAAHFAGYAYQVGVNAPFDRAHFTESVPILFACGGAMMVDRQVFLETGGFDEGYFIYYEDMDFGWRLWVLGYKVIFAPDSVVKHRHHGTMKSFADYRKRVLFKRNSLYSVVKNYDDENLGRILPSILLATVDSVVQQSVRRGLLDIRDYNITSQTRRRGVVDSFNREEVSTLVAIHDLVTNLPQIMKKRRHIQANRRRSDKEIARLFHWPFRYWPDVSTENQFRIADAFNVQELFEHLPRRVLIISSDILPYPGLPTVGSGLRAWGLGQGLASRGHQVLFSMPRAALVGREQLVPLEVHNLAWEPQTLLTTVREADPDVIVVCNWPVMDLLPVEFLGMPVVLDQHGPHFMEREYQKFGDRDDNARRKINALRKADFFTCAGQKQLAYFQSWLEKAGWTEAERSERTGFIPVSLSPDLPERHPAAEPIFVYGGVFLPWQDPSNGLLRLVEALAQNKRGKLHFYGGKHPVYRVDPGMFDILEGQLKSSPYVVARGMIPHDELVAEYTHAHVAMDLMKRNPERELAFTTRTVEYLWCGLPVIYNDYAELSDYIREYDAGWLVDPENALAIDKVLSEIFEYPEQVARRSLNAQRLVREKLTWDRTIGVLDHFVRYPRVRQRAIAGRQLLPGLGYLFSQARFHYRHGGIKTLADAGWAFIRRRI